MCEVQGGNLKILGLFCTHYPFAEAYDDVDVTWMAVVQGRQVAALLAE